MSKVALRRAIVALKRRIFESKRVRHAIQESFARVLAAEIWLMDGEHEEAVGLLEKVTGAHAELAKSYLRLLEGDEWAKACGQALWAVRDFDLAIQSCLGLATCFKCCFER